MCQSLPREIDYLRRYDQARSHRIVEMPDDRVDLMIGFLRQNVGHFPQRAQERELAVLHDQEAAAIDAN